MKGKRIGSAFLGMLILVMALLPLCVSAEEPENYLEPALFNDAEYENPVTIGSNLYDKEIIRSEFVKKDSTNPGVYTNVLMNGLSVEVATDPDAFVFLKIHLPAESYFLFRGSDILEFDAFILKKAGYTGSDYLSGAITDACIIRTGTDEQVLSFCFRNINDLFDLYRVKSFDTAYKVSKTTFRDDMEHLFENIDLSTFPTVRSSEPDVFFQTVAFYEDTDSNGNPTGLYLYIYTPSGKPVTGGSFSYLGNTATLEPVSVERWFTKFRIRGWAYRNKVENGQEITSIRRYDMGNVTLTYIDDNSITFKNTSVFMVNDADANGNKNVTATNDNKIYINIDYTYYRTDTSSEGAYYHNQIDSIYFNVPTYLEKDYGTVTDIKMVYNRVRTKPIFVTDETGLYYNYLKKYNSGAYVYWGDGLSIAKSDYFVNLPAVNPNPPLTSYVWDNDDDRTTVFNFFLVENVDAGIRDPASMVTMDELEQFMYSYPQTGDVVTGANGTIAADLFSTIDNGVEWSVSDLVTVTGSYASTHSWWEEMLDFGIGYMHDQDAETDVIQLKNTEEKIIRITNKNNQIIGQSDVTHFNPADEEKLVSCFDRAQNSSSTMYLAHFNVSQYYQCPAQWHWGIAGPWYDRMYIAQTDLYLNTHVLELVFTSDNGTVTAVPVKSNHIDCVADITPELTPREINAKSWQNILSKLPKLPDLREIGKILGIILGVLAVLVAVFFLGKLVDLIKPFIGHRGKGESGQKQGRSYRRKRK